MAFKRTLRTICGLTVMIFLAACKKDGRQDSFTIIGRTNSDDNFLSFIPVVLQRDGHKYYARCNNVKGSEDPKVTLRCNLHVGMTVRCQFFANRDVSGYDLICGTKRNDKGDLDTVGENELLFIDKEVY